MIKLFRNIRKKLIAEGKTTNYLKYAIGEIILVVIGILIALQINNWNENRKNRAEEKIVKTNLQEELLQIQNNMHVKINQLNISKNAVKELMGLFGKSSSEIQKINTDSLIYYSLTWPEFNPSSSVLNDLLQSGRLHLITNTHLRNLLFKWSPTIKEAESQYNEMIRFNNDKVFDYLNRYISFKNVDNYGMVFWNKKSVFKIDPSSLFSQLYYENMLEGQLYFFTASIDKLDDINGLIDNILKNTNKKND